MIILGVILALLGFWLLPDLAPDVPDQIDHLLGDLGIVFIIIGVLLFIFGLVVGPVGGRRYWY